MLKKLIIFLYIYLSISAIYGIVIIVDYFLPRESEQVIADRLIEEIERGRFSITKIHHLYFDEKRITITNNAYANINFNDTLIIKKSKITGSIDSIITKTNYLFQPMSSYFYIFPLIPLCFILPLFLNMFFLKNHSILFYLLPLDIIPIFIVLFQV